MNPAITLVIDGEQHEGVDLAASLTGLVERMAEVVVAHDGNPSQVTFMIELSSAGLLLSDQPESLIEAIPAVWREQQGTWIVQPDAGEA